MKLNKSKASWFSFIVPKKCDDYMASKKSTMSLNDPELVSKYNILAMNIMLTHIYAFTKDGNMYTY